MLESDHKPDPQPETQKGRGENDPRANDDEQDLGREIVEMKQEERRQIQKDGNELDKRDEVMIGKAIQSRDDVEDHGNDCLLSGFETVERRLEGQLEGRLEKEK